MTNKLTYQLIGALQLTVLIIVLIIILVTIFYKYTGVKYNRRFEKLYNLLEGEDPKYATEALNAAAAEPEEKRDAEYYYRLGVILQHNLNDRPNAIKNYEIALDLLNEQINTNPPNAPIINNDYLFITDHIMDTVNNTRMRNNARIIQQAGIRTQMTKIPYIGGNPVDNIGRLKTFKSDSQNVHDSSLNSDLIDQFRRLVHYNDEEGINISAENFAPHTGDQTKDSRINNVINVIKSNSSVCGLINATEYQLLESVWRRIHSKQNEKNRSKMIESLETQLNECAVTDTSTVCVAGRCGHVISSLALLDADQTIGILKTKEVLRNELLNDAARIVENYTGSKSAYDKKTIDDYNNNVETPDVDRLKKTMINEISALSNVYDGKLPDDQKNLLIQQSIAVVA